MPELPEVEVLVRHLAPVLRNRTISGVEIFREKVLRPTTPEELKPRLKGATFSKLSRRGKYLLFDLRKNGSAFQLLGHLGMTGRMYVLPKKQPAPKHAAVVLNLTEDNFIFEDTRYFGRFTLDCSALTRLGPEPFGRDFTVKHFAASLKRSSQAIKVKLLDQSVVAGVGNIYASEALFLAGISPRLPANCLQETQVKRLRQTIRQTLADAIKRGSTVPLNRKNDELFYFGSGAGVEDFYETRLRVYDRKDKPCRRCGTPIRRIIQAARSTFFCPKCQRTETKAR